jgi:hypothetical protein
MEVQLSEEIFPGRFFKVTTTVDNCPSIIPVSSAQVMLVGELHSIQLFSRIKYEQLAESADRSDQVYLEELEYDLTVLAENRPDGSFVIREATSPSGYWGNPFCWEDDLYRETVYTLRADGSKVTEYYTVAYHDNDKISRELGVWTLVHSRGREKLTFCAPIANSDVWQKKTEVMDSKGKVVRQTRWIGSRQWSGTYRGGG